MRQRARAALTSCSASSSDTLTPSTWSLVRGPGRGKSRWPSRTSESPSSRPAPGRTPRPASAGSPGSRPGAGPGRRRAVVVGACAPPAPAAATPSAPPARRPPRTTATCSVGTPGQPHRPAGRTARSQLVGAGAGRRSARPRLAPAARCGRSAPAWPASPGPCCAARCPSPRPRRVRREQVPPEGERRVPVDCRGGTGYVVAKGSATTCAAAKATAAASGARVLAARRPGSRSVSVSAAVRRLATDGSTVIRATARYAVTARSPGIVDAAALGRRPQPQLGELHSRARPTAGRSGAGGRRRRRAGTPPTAA